MSLNPVQFGTEVIDQFGRYLMTTFPIADKAMAAQVREHLTHDVGGERLIAKGPYVYLNRPFEQGPSVAELCADKALDLHPALKSIFSFEGVHKHQELALRSVKAGKNTVVATGTGSGKTEAFLLPIVDHALHLRDAGEPDGVVAVIVYPMNALADDQLRRLRPLLAGTRVTFGRYTGATPDEGDPESGHIKQSRAYTKGELKLLAEGKDEKVALPWEECVSREEIRARKPRLLLTNYSQLEYLLLRDKDLELFRKAPLRFLVFDEVHSYTGVLGSEVACLIRRLRHVTGKTATDVVCIGTSATVQENDSRIDANAATRGFASRLFGVDDHAVDLVTEHYRRQSAPTGQAYTPPHPQDPRKLLDDILEAARVLQLQDEVEDLTPELLAFTERLCGKSAAKGSSAMAAAYDLLAVNQLVLVLSDQFKRPDLLAKALPRLRSLNRQDVGESELVAELLCYLTLGALVHRDAEPLLRPKLHYFVQGYQGLGCSLTADGKPKVHFDAEAAHDDEGARVFPLVLCRSCGQHYFSLLAAETVNEDGVGVTLTRVPDRDSDAGEEETWTYITNALIGQNEDDSGELPTNVYLCRHCGTLHDAMTERCKNGKCDKAGSLVPVVMFSGDMKTCLACGTAAKGYEEVVTPVRSSEVADVTILSQSMLAAMPEESLQKLLVFTDNRQDAAFQAGWMEERSRRFRLRHVLYATLQGGGDRTVGLERLTEHIVDQAKERGILKPGVWDEDKNHTRVRWFLLEEFASTGQRKSSLESLALAEVLTKGIEVSDAPQLFETWGKKLGVNAQGIADVVRLIIDYYRRRGVVSDPLMCRKWSDRDLEVRDGLVSTFDEYRPQALVISKPEKSSYTKGFTAKNGRSGAQEIFRKGIPNGTNVSAKDRDRFLEEIWDWLTSSRVLVQTLLTYKSGGKQVALNVPGPLYQIDKDKLGFKLTDHRYLCPACGRTQSVTPPTGACPEYGCRGTLQSAGRDVGHFDVHQYTQVRFVPLKPQEHSAQVPKEERERIEREFKRESGGRYNCLVCTPTLELGVDIGKLEMALMRNVPPTPANYAQRAGRAGRRHRVGVVFSYCRGSAHDRYFFDDPRSMIAGEIRVPAFSMRNEPLIRKHAHSALLTALRELTCSEDKEALDYAFPPFIWAYFARKDQGRDKAPAQYLDEPRQVGSFAALVAKHKAALSAVLESVFAKTWPRDEAASVGPGVLGQFVEQLGIDLQKCIARLFAEVTTYRDELRELRKTEDKGFALNEEQETQRRRFGHALSTLLGERRQENYTLSHLTQDGFFPGYALARDSVTAQSLEPYLEVTRPAPVALRELTPANFIYANKNIFRVRKLNFYKVKADERTTAAVLQRQLAYDPEHKRVFDPSAASFEGGHNKAPVKVVSYQLVDVEMRRKQDIDDRERGRHRVHFIAHGMTLTHHAGGHEGKIGAYTCRYLRRQGLRLVNLGVPSRKEPKFSLFPMCTICGATRSPTATEAEIERFDTDHQKLHGQPTTGNFALHVEFTSDSMHLGPFEEYGHAVNVFEAVRIGARHVLDMGTTEVEGFTLADEHGRHWAILYDPMPGGSGFLPQIVQYWENICERGRHALESCASECETACYSCLKHFRNQLDHDILNRHTAINLLGDLAFPLTLDHVIPAVVVQPEVSPEADDSPAETNFVALCKARSFPVPPESQFKVDLGAGSYTIADFAYPEQKVLVFIDGMSKKLHGDPDRQRKDKVARAKLKMKGFHVVEITAEALQDDGCVAMHLEEIGIYLGQ